MPVADAPTCVPAAEVDEGAARVAGRLRALGRGPGGRVALLTRNTVAAVEAVLGCLRLGVVAVPLDVGLPTAALEQRLADADPALVLTDLDVVLPAGRQVLALGDTPGGSHDAAPLDGLGRWPRCRPMHFTSGTTGRAKGVWAGELGEEGGRALFKEERSLWGFGPDDTHLVVSALSHSGPVRFALNSVLAGSSLVVLERFSVEGVRAALAAHRITTSFMVPTHLARLLDAGVGAQELSSFRLLAHAGAPCPAPLKERVLEAFPRGVVWEFYGSTEGQFTACSPEGWHAHPGSVGRPRPGRRLEIRSTEDGSVLPDGEVGTVWCHAPPHARFSYWRAPEETAAAWDGDAFTVGDLGRLEDGWLTLAGRPGDLVITGGVNVYPAEVEQVLAAHPAVAEQAVFGVADEQWGERVVAAVVAVPQGRLDVGELRAWLRERLTGPQTPKEIVVVETLPRTTSGKVRRAELPGLIRG